MRKYIDEQVSMTGTAFDQFDLKEEENAVFKTTQNSSRKIIMDSKFSIEIKHSRTGLPIPVINGIHLHSIYNPEREAENFGQNKLEELKTNNNILVFGLGFGYHIDSLQKLMTQIWGEDYTIFVIEPNHQVYKQYLDLGLATNPNTTILCSNNIDLLFQERGLINFLLVKPVLIPHSPSFNLYSAFFKQFLSFKTEQSISSILKRNEVNSELSGYLSQFEGNQDLNTLADQIEQSKKINDENDFLILALKEFSSEKEATL